MTQTAIAEAFQGKGISARVVSLKVAAAKFMNHGGTRAEWDAIGDEIFGKGSEGHKVTAGNGRLAGADAPHGEAGLRTAADEVANRASASPTERSAGQASIANRVNLHVPVAAHQRHRPGHANRGAEAIAAVDNLVKQSLFASIKLPDGRSIGEVRWSEAPDLAQRYAKNARILIAAHRYAIPVDPSTSLGDCVPLDEQQHIVRMMERINAL